MVEALDSVWRTADSGIVLGVVALATLAAWRARKPADRRDYFLAGRRLAWPAVGISLAASEVGFALALVCVPWIVYRPGGSLGALHAVLIGSLLARFAVAAWFLPRFFEREIESPYALIGRALGGRAEGFATALFALGAAVSQAARLYLCALVLALAFETPLAGIQARTGVPGVVLIATVLSAVALFWTWRGTAGAVASDVVLLGAIVVAAAVALISVSSALSGGWELLWRVGIDSHKIDLWHLGRSPAPEFSFWAAAIAGTWSGIGAYGADQVVVQRLLCCKSARDARHALVLGFAGVVVVVLAALYGIGLFAWYERNEMSPAGLALAAQRGEHTATVFLAEVVPSGLKGWIVAGLAAAALSSSKAVFLALGQAGTSPARGRVKVAARARDALLQGRLGVVASALAVLAGAIVLGRITETAGGDLDRVLGFSAYTQGALLAGLLLALLRRPVEGSGYLWAAPLSVVAVYAVDRHEPRVDAVGLACAVGLFAAWIAARAWPAFSGRARARWRTVLQTAVLAIALGLLVWAERYAFVPIARADAQNAGFDWLPLATAWYVPLGSTIAFVLGCLLARGSASEWSSGNEARARATTA